MGISNIDSNMRPGVCTSTTRPTVPYEGQMIYETDTDLLLIWNGSSWRILAFASANTGGVLQVLSSTLTYAWTFSANQVWTDIPNLNITFTPRSTTSRVHIQAMVTGALYRPTANAVYLRLARDTTPICVGNPDGVRPQMTATASAPTSINADAPSMVNMTFLDTPPSTGGPFTYRVQIWQDTPSNPPYVNRSVADFNGGSGGRGASTLTIMEIAA